MTIDPRRPRILLGAAMLFGSFAAADPARADFFDDARRTFTTDIPHFFQDDIPCAFGGQPTSHTKASCDSGKKPAKPKAAAEPEPAAPPPPPDTAITTPAPPPAANQ